MEPMEFSFSEDGIRLGGFPEGAKFVRLPGHQALRLADLLLHRSDLRFALHCLTELKPLMSAPSIVSEALWRAALVHCVKCFTPTKNGRRQIPFEKIFAGNALAKEQYAYLKALRDGHVVHDASPISQCITGAVINPMDPDCKVAKIVATELTAITYEPEDVENLYVCAAEALAWVGREFDELADKVSAELEAKPLSELLAMEEVRFEKPSRDHAHRNRRQAT